MQGGGLSGGLAALLGGCSLLLFLAFLLLVFVGDDLSQLRFLDVLRTIRHVQTVEILILIADERLEEATRIAVGGRFGIHEQLLVGIGDEAQLHEAGRHGGEAQHGEVVLVGTLVETPRGSADALLEEACQLDTALHVLILDELEHDVALGRVVEPLIALLIVFLHVDDRVLALGHLKVFLDALLAGGLTAPEGVGLVAMHGRTFRHGIDVNRHEEVGLVLIGYLGTLPEFKETVGGACIDDFHVGTVALYNLSEGQCIAQGERLLLAHLADAASVLATVSGIDDKHKLAGGGSHGDKERKE